MSDMVQATAAPAAARVSDAYRWTQLAIGVAAMVMIANYQYGWTFFVPDIQKTFGWDRASIQWAFTLFVLFETWLVPVEAWFVDKYGPRLVIMFGGIMIALAWVLGGLKGVNGMAIGLIVALALAVVLWALGRRQARGAGNGAAWIAALLVTAAGIWAVAMVDEAMWRFGSA